MVDRLPDKGEGSISVENILGADSAGATQRAERRQNNAPGEIDFRAILDAFEGEAANALVQRTRETTPKKHGLSEEGCRNLSAQ